MVDIIMSDLHLGEELPDCVLADPKRVDQFADELSNLSPIRNLVLLGDILDLSLSPLRDALCQFSRFIERVESIPESIIYVPGNHDHHIWTLHVECELISSLEEGSVCDTPVYSNREFKGKKSPLSGYLSPAARDKFCVCYPTFSLELDGKRCLLHHGHQLYGVGVKLLSLAEALDEIPQERRIQELELQNIGVYELLWYYLELSSSLRQQVERNWEQYGGFGAFSLVAREILDSWPSLLGYNLRKLFRKTGERGKRIRDLRDDILLFLQVFNEPVECFIFGHSHESELVAGSVLGRGFPRVIGNCGCWTRGYGTYIVLASDYVSLYTLGAGWSGRLVWD